jgi:hypothetical protein
MQNYPSNNDANSSDFPGFAPNSRPTRFRKLRLLLAVLPLVLDAMVMMFDAVMGLRPNRAGLFGCPRALVLLRRAHRPHRQFETRALLGAGRQGKHWNDDGESAKGDQPQRMMMHDVHGVTPATKMRCRHANR